MFPSMNPLMTSAAPCRQVQRGAQTCLRCGTVLPDSELQLYRSATAETNRVVGNQKNPWEVRDSQGHLTTTTYIIIIINIYYYKYIYICVCVFNCNILPVIYHNLSIFFYLCFFYSSFLSIVCNWIWPVCTRAYTMVTMIGEHWWPMFDPWNEYRN
jgi:hypothetical protein